MRDLIARALFEQIWSGCGHPHASFESYDGDGPEHNPYRASADAVLSAMRIPSAEMTEAGGQVIRNRYSHSFEPDAIWQAMIDAAKR